VCTRTTGHAEVVVVPYDPEAISYGELLEMFFRVTDPTTLARQGNDVGTQYRSAIFYQDEVQRDVAVEVIRELDQDGPWDGSIVTTVEPLGSFYPAEDYHDEYFRRNGEQPYCRVVVEPKVTKFRQRFAHRMKSGSA